MRWNCRALLAACEELIKRPDTSLTLRTLTAANTTAQNSFSWSEGQVSDARLVVDPAQASLVEGFLHEALHAVLAKELGDQFNSVLEEVCIKAIEQHLWLKTFNRSDTSRWRRLINAKLK